MEPEHLAFLLASGISVFTPQACSRKPCSTNCKVVSLRSRDFWAMGILGNLPQVWVSHDGVWVSCRHFLSGRGDWAVAGGRCEGRRQADRRALAAEKGGQRPAASPALSPPVCAQPPPLMEG